MHFTITLVLYLIRRKVHFFCIDLVVPTKNEYDWWDENHSINWSVSKNIYKDQYKSRQLTNQNTCFVIVLSTISQPQFVSGNDGSSSMWVPKSIRVYNDSCNSGVRVAFTQAPTRFHFTEYDALLVHNDNGKNEKRVMVGRRWRNKIQTLI